MMVKKTLHSSAQLIQQTDWWTHAQKLALAQQVLDQVTTEVRGAGTFSQRLLWATRCESGVVRVTVTQQAWLARLKHLTPRFLQLLQQKGLSVTQIDYKVSYRLAPVAPEPIKTHKQLSGAARNALIQLQDRLQQTNSAHADSALFLALNQLLENTDSTDSAALGTDSTAQGSH